jgi:hypothetical protein
MFFYCYYLFFQGQEVPGYVILIGGNDTLKGIVDTKAIGMLYQKVNFIYSCKNYKIRPGADYYIFFASDNRCCANLIAESNFVC